MRCANCRGTSHVPRISSQCFFSVLFCSPLLAVFFSPQVTFIIGRKSTCAPCVSGWGGRGGKTRKQKGGGVTLQGKTTEKAQQTEDTANEAATTSIITITTSLPFTTTFHLLFLFGASPFTLLGFFSFLLLFRLLSRTRRSASPPSLPSPSLTHSLSEPSIHNRSDNDSEKQIKRHDTTREKARGTENRGGTAAQQCCEKSKYKP